MSKATEVLEQMGGMQVSKNRAPFCHRRIERLAARAGIKKPLVYVIPDSAPNACAVGLSRDDSAVAVTTGLLRNLDENEIESVLAHEVGHIQKGHCIEKTKVAMKAMAISAVAEIGGRMMATSDLDLTPDDDDPDDLLSTALKIGIGAAVAGAGGAAASNIMTADSFRSEFEADECGGEFGRKPWALASALKRIEDLTKVGEKKFAPEVSQLFIISPAYLNYQTHPPTAERIQRLSNMDTELPKLPNIPTIYCSSCGEKTDGDGSYCYWCGGELDAPSS
jgi:heat shock protein HtpX